MEKVSSVYADEETAMIPPATLAAWREDAVKHAMTSDPDTWATFIEIRDARIVALCNELTACQQKQALLVGLVLAQAEDEGLWFHAVHASEGYLQQELRKLHAAVESDCDALRGRVERMENELNGILVHARKHITGDRNELLAALGAIMCCAAYGKATEQELAAIAEDGQDTPTEFPTEDHCGPR